ncbi:MAG: I78 family peptidase inhibitor [Sphingorhabdus sp.]
MLLTGCTTPEREAPYTTERVPVEKAGGFECTADPLQYAIGQKTSVALALELMAKSGATILRWIPPRTAVTMDFNPARLNISYDDDMVINRVSCG